MRHSVRSRSLNTRHRHRTSLEPLEERSLLSTLPDLRGLTATLPVAGDAHSRIHVIGGIAHQFTWDDLPVAADATSGSPPAGLSSATYPLTSLPALHSNPSAKATLYLDFNGHYQATWGAWSNITTPVYDFDGDLTTFSDAELASIVESWTRAAEDYAPFNVDVTTVEPAVLAPGAPESGANGK